MTQKHDKIKSLLTPINLREYLKKKKKENKYIKINIQLFDSNNLIKNPNLIPKKKKNQKTRAI